MTLQATVSYFKDTNNNNVINTDPSPHSDGLYYGNFERRALVCYKLYSLFSPKLPH